MLVIRRLVMLVVLAVVASSAPFVASPRAVAAIDPPRLGASSDTAAGSCWEIKQAQASASSGAYWLLTPTMTEPQQFYCDMQTSGGGWVLVGQGRDGWTIDYDGKGDAATLLTPGALAPSSTVQLPSSTIQALMGSGRVDGLADGVRLRRAKDAAGTSWQEVRVKYSKFGPWAWTFGAEYPVASWSFDTVTGSGGTSATYGTSNGYNVNNNVPLASNTYRRGFAYGSTITGTSAESSYLWSATNAGGALPVTQVYIRPKVLSNDSAFTAIPDGGVAGHSQPSLPRSRALASPWGVTGLAGNQTTEGNVEVQAFTQSGSTMYVGGNFQYVQRDAAGTGRVSQPFLAAFDVTTGEFLPGFRPVLNEQVHDLATLPNGAVVAAGEFTQANGAPVTGIVALDPATGATDPRFKLTVENRLTNNSFRINTLLVAGSYLYVGGAVTHFAGGSRPTTFVYTRGLARVAVADGTPDRNWKPSFNGTVNDVAVSPDGSRAYAVGYFTMQGDTAALKAAAVSTGATATAVTPAWTPSWSSTNNYQRSVDAVGDKIWVGGSEHSLFQFDSATFARTMGDIAKPHGDIQAITHAGGAVFAGCHCDDYSYQNAYSWPTLSSGWTSGDALRWLGAWDATTGKRLPSFTPNLEMRQGTGIWAISADSTGVLWAGGDVTATATSSQAAAYAGGFVRFPLNDSTAPTEPRNLQLTGSTSSTATLSWTGSTDAGGGVRYVVLRDDRPIAATTGNLTSITVPLGGSNRFFVRAVDKSGNYSATTSVVSVSGAHLPPAAAFTATTSYSAVAVDGSGSSASQGEIVDYRWDFGDGAGARGVTAEHGYASAGTYIVTLTVTDSSGVSGQTSRTVTVTAPANPPPADPYGKAVYGLSPTAYYRLGESSGSTAKDSGPEGRTGTYVGTLTRGTAGALAGSTDTAVTASGTQAFVTSPRVSVAPTTFSLGVWFKTTSTSGGRLIGYSSSATGSSSSYDRHLFLRSDGTVVFGAYNGAENRVTSTRAVNDGAWHLAVATMSPTDGMRLYLDGVAAGANPNGTAENFLGYWRVGADNVWSGASTGNLTGSLDEAAVFSTVLSPSQIADLYTLGSVGPGGANTPPTAVFASSVSSLTAQLDASGSVDTDGTIKSYAWSFGDGTTGVGQLVSHTYPQAGTYPVTLTVTDDRGATHAVTQEVTTTAAPVTSSVIASKSIWQWRYESVAPPTGWAALDFDSSAWSSGPGVLGFGSTPLGTMIDTYATTSARPLAAYFRREFTVPDAGKVTRLVLTTVADDGVVVYVNGTEVGRSNMPAGPVTSTTYASSARRTAVANSAPFVIEVPPSLLVSGRNVIAAETHLNFRGTTDAGFDLSAVMTASP